MKIQIRQNFLRAAQIVAAHNDIRYYLNGVLIEIMPDEVRYVATDGHRLLVLRDTESGGEARQIIVPHDVIDRMPKQHEKPTIPELVHEDGAAEYRIADLMFRPIDGKFPEYRKIIPESATKEWAQFRTDYVASFEEAARIASPHRSPLAQVWPNGLEKCALVSCGDDAFIGVLMPFHPDKEPKPLWVMREPEAVAA